MVVVCSTSVMFVAVLDLGFGGSIVVVGRGVLLSGGAVGVGRSVTVEVDREIEMESGIVAVEDRKRFGCDHGQAAARHGNRSYDFGSRNYDCDETNEKRNLGDKKRSAAARHGKGKENLRLGMEEKQELQAYPG
ncbi:hypothetical protein L1987_00139 [Smallanthus sonchifolius]|uniref:Uncharacterized protein n=1 Tax=Smallanthus sonchifolius TaxID=185202 RepID=A0ACB9K1C1_9ASTR|nr:hypothetical protein L1987_00139 [Smallanthus sonchifolius]